MREEMGKQARREINQHFAHHFLVFFLSFPYLSLPLYPIQDEVNACIVLAAVLHAGNVEFAANEADRASVCPGVALGNGEEGGGEKG